MTNTMTTPSAEASLRPPLSHLAQIRTDKTLFAVPASIRGMETSRNTKSPVHNPPNTNDERTNGTTTHHIVPNRRAPHTCADSSSSRPTCNGAALVIRVTYDNRLTTLAKIMI